MTRRAPDAMVSNNSLVSTIIIYPYAVLLYPWTNYGKFRFTIVVFTPTGGEPSSVNHFSESKISAHFPQWFSEQLDNTFFILWSNNNKKWSTVTDCSGTLSAAFLNQQCSLCLMGQLLVLSRRRRRGNDRKQEV